MSATIDTWAGGLGLLAGFCAIAMWVALAGRPAEAPAPSASIRVAAAASGALAVTPLGQPVLHGAALRPGTPGESGMVSIRNQTPRPLDVSLRLTAIQGELDHSAWIEVSDGPATVLRTLLSRAHAWSSRTIGLAPGARRRLRARVWIPRGAADGWQAARGDLSLEFRGSAR
jgi:hypothetical protein